MTREVYGQALNYDKREWAYASFAAAENAGLIQRAERCSECDASGNIEAHHEDYAKPFDVDWLCKRCHSRRHVQLASGQVGGSVGARLRWARRSLGHNQSFIADLAGVNQTVVSHWERDLVSPRVDEIARVVAGLGLDGTWLVFGKGSPGIDLLTGEGEGPRVGEAA